MLPNIHLNKRLNSWTGTVFLLVCRAVRADSHSPSLKLRPNNAGLVKWYNNSFPNCGREFDSPIPHNMKKFLLVLVLIVFLIIIVRSYVGFSSTVISVVNSKGEPISNAELMYNFNCGSANTNLWQTDNIFMRTDDLGKFQIPSYKSFKLGNILAKCSKQVFVYKKDYSHYKNTCEQTMERVGTNEVTNLEVRNACSDTAYVKPSADTFEMRLDLIEDAPDYDPSQPNLR